MFENNLIAGAAGQAGGFYPYQINQSLRFNDDDSAYLSRTPASAGNRKTFTFSVWVKRSSIGSSNEQLLSATAFDGDYNRTRFGFFHVSPDELSFEDESGGNVFRCRTNALFSDTSAWYHCVLQYDSTQATASNRVKIYVNGISNL